MNLNVFLKFFFLIISITGLFDDTSAQTGKSDFYHDLKGNRLPWTKTPGVDADNFRFIIAGDLTGGEQPGVFDQAVKRINDLAPDFVITVGDLIEGYTHSQNEMQRQWETFLRSLQKLEAPFFFAPGNHDITTEMLLREWKRRLGHHYYNFYVGNVLFLVLNSTEPGVNGFSEKQVNYVSSVLEEHRKGDPVFVILHNALWGMEGKQGVEKLNDAFDRHEVTFFCGHEHRYQFRMYNGKHHYMLAALAAGGKKGASLGEFHNMMQVTVKNENIRIANIELEGLHPHDIVDEQTIKQVDILRSENWAHFVPVVAKSADVSEVNSFLILKNDGDYPMLVQGEWDTSERFEIQPDKIDARIMSGGKVRIPVYLNMRNDSTIRNLHGVSLLLNAHFEQEEKQLNSSANPVWHIDYIRETKHIEQQTLDPILLKPGQIYEAWDWDGPGDASFSIASGYDNENLYIKAKVKDDHWVTDSQNGDLKGDILQLVFQPDTSHQSSDPAVFEFSLTSGNALCIAGCEKVKGFSSESTMKKQTFEANLIIPRNLIINDSFRINMAYSDVDNPDNLDNAELWWKPPWNTSDNYPMSGVFIID
ncbi:MAG: metallophosphoesterase [Bacteroidota bacterium]